MTAAKVRSLAIAVIAFSAAALSASSCNLEPGAHSNPTYEADVRPIFMSRCIRCHGSPLLGDPTAVLPSPPTAIVRFDVFGDTNCDVDGGGPQCVSGAAYEASTHMKFKTFLSLPQKSGGMPPAPAAPLTSYQLDTILTWEQENPLLEK